MTRTTLPLPVADLSAFTKTLARDLAAQGSAPGHLTLMNMLARAAGFQNLQHLRAQHLATARLDAPKPLADARKVEQILRCFDTAGRMTRWPAKTADQRLCVWALWSRLPAETDLTERQISALLNDWHLFGDAAILRRTMVELRLVSRSDGALTYRRLEQPPPPEAREVIARLHARS